jgi:hypothetical protein
MIFAPTTRGFYASTAGPGGVARVRSPMSNYEKGLRRLQMNLEGARAKPEHQVARSDGLSCSDRIMQAINEIEALIRADVAHEDALGYSCWQVRAESGSLIDWTLQGIGLCRDLEGGGQMTMLSVADLIQPCEPGLADTARSLAGEAATAGETYKDIEPDLADVWRNTPAWVKGLGGLVLLLTVKDLVK